MESKLICCSHSPLLKMSAKPPQAHQQIAQLFESYQSQVENYQPDLVLVLGCDHFNGFFLDCMPSFCLGVNATAVADVGGTPGELCVTEQAMHYASALRENGIDMAVSNQMRVDHGFSQSMQLILGCLKRYPCLPIFVNSIAPPYVPFHRSRALGEQLAAVIHSSGVERLLVIATGGMSHNPTRYYPDPKEAEQKVRHYQINGPSEEGMTHSQWLDRLDVMHQEGAQMLVDGRRTIADIKMNPPLDKQFAALLCAGDVYKLDHYSNEEMIAKGGIGFSELHTWVAACALQLKLEPKQLPKLDIYAETLEYGIGFGAISSGFNG